MTHSSKRELTLRNSKGFTLIELLVVIAIIGILASIVLASLSSARSKGADSSIKANFQSLRSQAEIAATGSSYTGICSNAQTISILSAIATSSGLTVSAVDATLGNAATNAKVSCHVAADGSAYAMQAPLKSDNTQSWCIDSTGNVKQATSYMGASATTCP